MQLVAFPKSCIEVFMLLILSRIYICQTRRCLLFTVCSWQSKVCKIVMSLYVHLDFSLVQDNQQLLCLIVSINVLQKQVRLVSKNCSRGLEIGW